MWPWTHLAFGYVLYSGSHHLRLRGAPTDTATVLLVIGTQFPDLVDKPLAMVGVLPVGRSLAHSALVAGLAMLIVTPVVLRSSRMEPEHWLAFGVGYGSHLLGDSIYRALAGDFAAISFLGWPLFPSTEETLVYTAAGILGLIEFHPVITDKLLIGVGAVGLWLLDGHPGVDPVFRAGGRFRRWMGDLS